MTTLDYFLFWRSVPRNKTFEIEQLISECCKKIPYIEVDKLMKQLPESLRQSFLDFCNKYSLIRPTRFSDKWMPQYPHSVAPKHGKPDPRDWERSEDKAYYEVFK